MALPKVLRALWGNLTSEEVGKFSILSGAFFTLIGSYWLLRVMKDSIFTMLVGYQYQPIAKMISPFMIVLAVIFYGKLVDWLKRTTLFYSIALFFGALFLAISYFLTQPQIFEATQASFIGRMIPGNVLGWMTYFFIEMFGSIVPAMYWSFVASVMTADSAKRGYGMISAMGQIGQILGAGLVAFTVTRLGQPMLFAFGGAAICLLPLIVRLYAAKFPEGLEPKEEEMAPGAKKPKTGLFEGLRLILSRPYLAGLFVVTTSYEIISTVVEYQLGMSILSANPDVAVLASIKGLQGIFTGILAALFSFLGTSYFMRTFGLKFCLMAFPSVVGVTLLFSTLVYLSGVSMSIVMWTFLAAVVIFKAFSYTLNNPTKEVMYIPTSKDVKFKAKSWIDAFGNRSTKLLGATITNTFKHSLNSLVIFGSMISLGIVGFWILAAAFVGNTFNKLQKENRIID